MNKKIDPKWNDVLVLKDTRVVRFVQRGSIDDVLIVADANGFRSVIREYQVQSHYPRNPERTL